MICVLHSYILFAIIFINLQILTFKYYKSFTKHSFCTFLKLQNCERKISIDFIFAHLLWHVKNCTLFLLPYLCLFCYFLFISIFEREKKFLPIKIFHKMHTFSYLFFWQEMVRGKIPSLCSIFRLSLVELIFQWKNNVLRRNTACQNVYWQHFKIPWVAIHNSGNFPAKLSLGTHLDFSPRKNHQKKKF